MSFVIVDVLPPTAIWITEHRLAGGRRPVGPVGPARPPEAGCLASPPHLRLLINCDPSADVVCIRRLRLTTD